VSAILAGEIPYRQHGRARLIAFDAGLAWLRSQLKAAPAARIRRRRVSAKVRHHLDRRRPTP
jgi:hypothetical protein